MTIEDVFSTMDWKLLSEQKLWLLKQDADHAIGLINLLDAIQDVAQEAGYPVVWLKD